MRVQVFNTLAGAIGLPAIVSSAPNISYGGINSDICVDPSTVFVTVSPSPSTVYVTVGGAQDPTTTVTHYSTLHSTLSVSTALTSVTTDIAYDFTVTQTAVVTVTQPNPTHIASEVTTKGTSSSGLVFYVDNGTTYWLGGQTPASTGSYVLVTSAVTVYPVDPNPTIVDSTSTLTVHTTVHSTHHVTQTLTVSIPTATAGTGSVYTGLASGGWNATSSGNGFTAAVSTPGLATSSHISLNFHPTSQTTYSLSSYAAQSGFYAFTSTTRSAVSSAGGQSTKTTISCTNATAPYANSTGLGTSSAQGIVSSSITQYPTAPPPTVGPHPTNTTHPITSSSRPADPTATGSLLALGAACSSSSQCANGAACYAVNSMLIPVCGNFQATCQSDSQCAFNTCVSGFCSGPEPLTSSNSSIVPHTSHVAPTYGYPASAPVTLSPTNSNISSNPVFTTIVAPTATSSKDQSQMFTTTTSSASSVSPTKCGEQGDFTLNFDDIPPLGVSNLPPNSTIHPAPVFNPYHQFLFSDGFTVGPPPEFKYKASSPPLLTEFIPFYNSQGNNSNAGPNTAEYGYSGHIADGDFGLLGCFVFNFYGASFGCNSTGPDCDFTFSGYKYNVSTKADDIVAIEKYGIAACVAQKACPLTPVVVDSTFHDLTSIRINATVAGEPEVWWMDDLKLGWFDNSCKAGLCRLNAHIH